MPRLNARESRQIVRYVLAESSIGCSLDFEYRNLSFNREEYQFYIVSDLTCCVLFFARVSPDRVTQGFDIFVTPA